MAGVGDEVRQILAAFEASGWDELYLQTDTMTLHVGTVAGEQRLGPQGAAAPTVPPAAPPTASAPATSGAPAAPAPPAATETGGVVTPGDADLGATVDVCAPSLGLAWRAPHPGAPPFVEVGDRVEPGTTVCIVEVMKLMNHVKAGVAGEVVAVLAENGAMVEFDEPLFRIRPDGA